MNTIKRFSTLYRNDYRNNDASWQLNMSSNRSGAPPDGCNNRLKHKEILKEKGRKL
jgi:hypothetical protein